MPLTLRNYQTAAKNALYGRMAASSDSNPLIVLPTGSGKTPVIASICDDAVNQFKPSSRVLILAHVRELIEQTAEKIEALSPGLHVGIYSAGLGSRDTLAPVIIGQIQSVCGHENELGHFDICIIDEAHMCRTDDTGRYCRMLAAIKTINPNLRIIGLTATPYRMDSGLICGGENSIFTEIAYEARIPDLVAQGFLCPVISKGAVSESDFAGVHTRAGEYVSSEVESIVTANPVIDAACNELVRETSTRRAVLMFCQSLDHAEKVTAKMKALGQNIDGIFGDTMDFQRDAIIEDFRAGRLKYLVNVGVLTTGFDAPNIDCVALFRPTLSTGLYYQMVGRGFRTCPGKMDCLILDFGKNIERHGPVDLLEPSGRTGLLSPEERLWKQCRGCRQFSPRNYSICLGCNQAFETGQRTPRAANNHEHSAERNGIMEGQETITRYEIGEVVYSVHQKREGGIVVPDAPASMRVDYEYELGKYKSQWVCFDHVGFARTKADQWWQRMGSGPAPETVQDAVAMCRSGHVRQPVAIRVKHVAGKKFDEIIDYEFVPERALTPTPEPSPPPEMSFDNLEQYSHPLHHEIFTYETDGAGLAQISGAQVQMFLDSGVIAAGDLMLLKMNGQEWASAEVFGFRFGNSPEPPTTAEVFDLSPDEIPF